MQVLHTATGSSVNHPGSFPPFAGSHSKALICRNFAFLSTKGVAGVCRAPLKSILTVLSAKYTKLEGYFDKNIQFTMNFSHFLLILFVPDILVDIGL